MDITYNNITAPRNLVTFSDVPNILTVSEEQSGTQAQIVIQISTGITASSEGQYYITLLGDTITSTLSPSTANNKLFYIANGDNETTAAYITKAFRNCNNVTVSFTVQQSSNAIGLEARQIGSFGSLSGLFSTNIPSSMINVAYTDGTQSTQLYGAKVMADVYVNNKYKTNLEKSFYNDSVAFNLSPVISAYSEFGKLTPYNVKLSAILNDGTYMDLENDISGSTINGYLANDSDKYTYMTSQPKILINKTENDELYIYGDLQLSLLTSGDTEFNVKGYNGDGNVRFTYNGTAYTENGIAEVDVTIPTTALTSSVTLEFSASTQNITFNVIKPTRGTEYVQRVAWRNEYGGISFFDFTGKKQDTFNMDASQYKKNVFDFYTSPSYEESKIYMNKENKTVRLTSHLMDKKGIRIFNSLARSRSVWTYVDGIKKYIIPTGLEVTEDGTFNDVYTAQLTYKYSFEE